MLAPRPTRDLDSAAVTVEDSEACSRARTGSGTIARLDPETDYEEIYRVMTTLEFPWDMNQALSFALFRTYAVPSIGRLLDETGEFARDTQKRYDDTGLLLDEPSPARAAQRPRPARDPADQPDARRLRHRATTTCATCCRRSW